MTKKIKKEIIITIDESVMKALGIDEQTPLDKIIGDSLIIRPRDAEKAEKIREKDLKIQAKRILNKYEPVFKKLAKT